MAFNVVKLVIKTIAMDTALLVYELNLQKTVKILVAFTAEKAKLFFCDFCGGFV